MLVPVGPVMLAGDECTVALTALPCRILAAMRRAILASVLIGCATSTSLYRPQTEAIPAGLSDAEVFAAAVQVFSEQGLVIRQVEPQLGMLTSEWRLAVGSDVPQDTEEHAWRILVANGQLQVFIDCRHHSLTNIEECGDPNRRASDWLRYADFLREDIIYVARVNARKRAGIPASAPAP